jgi:hypothetical protein
MATWRTVATLVLVLASSRSGLAQTYTLAEPIQVDHCQRIRLDMSLSGNMRINRDGKAVDLPLKATATHDFPERILSVDLAGLPDKSARLYENAQAMITVSGDRSDRSLRPERRLIVAQRLKDRYTVYSPAGPLTREELDLASEHFNTLALTGLLPSQPVAVGASWKIGNPAAQVLCSFEGLTEQKLECKLEAVENRRARVSIAGKATGIDLGALVKLTIQGTYEYDLNLKRLVHLEWNQKDERDQGPASPATESQTKIVLDRAIVPQPASLSDVALVSVPEGLETPERLTQLEYQHAKTGIGMLYGRDWQTVSQDDEHVVMRLLDHGDFVAQLTITPWTAAEKGQHLSPQEFQDAMAATAGWESENELQAGVVPADGGKWIYRISAQGQLDGEKVLQNFYLIAGPGGEQLVLTFTMTPKQADRLGNRDLSIAANINFPSTRRDTEKPK